MGYAKAFSEAAMVGALADWFAVTALFHHPLGLKIPHTNLIESKKNDIGNNLGSFVVEHFFNGPNIRPYILKLSLMPLAVQWLGKPANKRLLHDVAQGLLRDILQKANDDKLINYLAARANEGLRSVPVHRLAARAMRYFLGTGQQAGLITSLAGKIRDYIDQHHDVIKEYVKKESYFFIPGFVDNKLAQKIGKALSSFVGAVENDPGHPLRSEIEKQLARLADDWEREESWALKFEQAKQELLATWPLERQIRALWEKLRTEMLKDLDGPGSMLSGFIERLIDDMSARLEGDLALQNKADQWIRWNAYKYIVRYADRAGELISRTVGQWEGKDLSRKLELEVGKDLQYIRINGTLVGGLVGLVIYTLTTLLL